MEGASPACFVPVERGWFVDGATINNAVLNEIQLLCVEVFAMAEASARSSSETGSID
jgi:hypothetical protein